MGEIKRAVNTIEVNYVCDKCNHGMMQSSGDPDPQSREVPHRCMICGYEQSFMGVSYPRIDYVGEGENF